MTYDTIGSLGFLFYLEANLAIGKIPSISETRYRVPESNESVDGDYLTCQITYPRGNHAWWMVELEKRYQIQRIALLISLGYSTYQSWPAIQLLRRIKSIMCYEEEGPVSYE